MLGTEHPDVAWSLRDLGELADARGDTAAAMDWFGAAIATFTAVNGPDHPELAAILDELRRSPEHARRPADAAATKARADEIRPESESGEK